MCHFLSTGRWEVLIEAALSLIIFDANKWVENKQPHLGDGKLSCSAARHLCTVILQRPTVGAILGDLNILFQRYIVQIIEADCIFQSNFSVDINMKRISTLISSQLYSYSTLHIQSALLQFSQRKTEQKKGENKYEME